MRTQKAGVRSPRTGTWGAGAGGVAVGVVEGLGRVAVVMDWARKMRDSGIGRRPTGIEGDHEGRGGVVMVGEGAEEEEEEDLVVFMSVVWEGRGHGRYLKSAILANGGASVRLTHWVVRFLVSARRGYRWNQIAVVAVFVRRQTSAWTNKRLGGKDYLKVCCLG